MIEQQRGFRGIWLPRELWFDENLNWTEKLLLAEIDSLDDSRDGGVGCRASNRYLADFFQLNKVYVSQLISSLIKKGYASSKGVLDGRARILTSNLSTVLTSTKTAPAASGKKKKEVAKVKIEIPDSLMIVPGFVDQWAEFLEVRVKKKKPMTDRAKKRMLEKLDSEFPKDLVVACLVIACDKTWTGIEWDWCEKLLPKKLASNAEGFDEKTFLESK